MVRTHPPLCLVLLPLLFWYAAIPVVRIHYSEEGTDELRLIWKKPHNIHKERSGRAWFLCIPLLPIVFFVVQTFLEPTGTVHYAENGKEELRYIWNVQHRIYKGQMQPGGGTSDKGFIFPDEDFFMHLNWWGKKGRHHCVSITPKWPNTNIYLDLNGNIDTAKGVGTDEDRLDQCKGDWAKP